MITTLFFYFSMTAAYVVPASLNFETEDRYLSTEVVYYYDYRTSVELFPDEMGGPGLSDSEIMTYAGMGASAVMPIIVESKWYKRQNFPPGFDFIAYSATLTTFYFTWHYADTGEVF